MHVFVCVTWCFVLVYVCVYVYTESSCNKDWEGGIKRMERVDRIRLLSNVEMESTNWFYLHFLVYLFPLFIVLYSEFFFSNLFSFSFFYSSEPNLFYSRFFFLNLLEYRYLFICLSFHHLFQYIYFFFLYSFISLLTFGSHIHKVGQKA